VRLQAAHSLYKNDHKQFSQSDHSGKKHHYKIVEQKNEKTHATRITVFELDGKNARLTLDGTLDSTLDQSGKFAAAKEQSRQENRAENKREIKLEQEVRHRERRHKDEDSPSHRRHRQQREHAGQSHRRKLDSYEQAEPIKAIDNQRARQAFAQGANLYQNLPSDRLIKLDNGMVYLHSKLTVDADGGKTSTAAPGHF
jgi:hypothetical protein